ncbi:MAG: ABC transporter ATP-binding protein [Chloroflexi bacterium]|nr:ABC transporter ATP-binding protein [Chloroflexota bacterium]
MTEAIALEGVWVRYAGQPRSEPALRNVSLRVEDGERVLLLGPNGAGKSSLLRVCAGLVSPARGSILIRGLPSRKARGLLGVVAHTTYLYDELTALENLRLYGELYGIANPERRALELLERVALRRAADSPVGHFSRGQQQRVSIARAFLHDPPIVLLDEPDTSLDLDAFELLAELAGARDRTVLMASHDVAAGLRLASRVLVLAGGCIVDEHSPVDRTSVAPLVEQVLGLARPRL